MGLCNGDCVVSKCDCDLKADLMSIDSYKVGQLIRIPSGGIVRVFRIERLDYGKDGVDPSVTLTALDRRRDSFTLPLEFVASAVALHSSLNKCETVQDATPIHKEDKKSKGLDLYFTSIPSDAVYKIQKAEGDKLDKDAKYLLLRLDNRCPNKDFMGASKFAASAFTNYVFDKRRDATPELKAYSEYITETLIELETNGNTAS